MLSTEATVPNSVRMSRVYDPPKALRSVRKRKLVDAMCGEWDVSIWRACRVLEIDTSTYHYKSRRPRTGWSRTAAAGRSYFFF
jgi:hypothetical protein